MACRRKILPSHNRSALPCPASLWVPDFACKIWFACAAVRDSKELREAVEVVQPEKVKLGLRLSQSRPLYEGFKQLKEGHWDALSRSQRRLVDGELRDFVLGGKLSSLHISAVRPLACC